MSSIPMLGLAGDHTLGAVHEMPEIRKAVQTSPLTLADRRLLIDQAAVVIEGLYAHLPHKRAMYAIDPGQRLRLLRGRLPTLSDAAFHAELVKIFTQLRDGHTEYVLPEAYQGPVAFLGIRLERCWDGETARHLVTARYGKLTGDEHLVPGVEVTHWNGMPIEMAVARNAEREFGGNSAARDARGLQAMAIRPFVTSSMLDEDWVDLRYVTQAGEGRDVRIPWRVFDSIDDLRRLLAAEPSAVGPASAGTVPTAVGFDLRTTLAQRMRKRLFAASARAGSEEIATTRPELRARIVRAGDGREFGHLRIFSFHVEDLKADGDVVDDIIGFLDEVARLLELMPKDGLIVDVRDNGGGFVVAAEYLLQMFTPNRIAPGLAQFVCTPTTAAFAEALDEMVPWRDSIAESVLTGAQYSSGVPLDPADFINTAGQLYHGPVVLVTDALCYSATDTFAAGFQDNRVGPVLGVDTATGAGGAEVRTHSAMSRDWPGGPLRPLPGGADFRLSIRRTLRVGRREGQVIEDFGVVPDDVHRLTRRDLLEDNADLMAAAIALLREGRPRTLDVDDVAVDGSRLTLTLTTRALTGIDVYAADRPVAITPVADGTTTVSFTLPRAPEVLVRLLGFDGTVLAAARNLRFKADGTGRPTVVRTGAMSRLRS
ncbi:hypothetical protein Pth03_51870 [Planotetraspora thailandica]|uniref:Tail specific protease domain-containing protein n=1 Tax=Planotetraspora thailandica TaxID=487172 RepID=A0A8J3V4W8_9ACTN|nr:S41 family peptidase [Planotetraspora thailandica]GII56798.1 hypothetical protein Pth03_51870 [Planotetraspora thailandica]